MAARLHFLRCTLAVLMLGIAYGVAHDLVTAHVCVEYFTRFHPQIVETENPLLLALVWGVAATWWVAVALGMVVGLAASAGKRPLAPLGHVVRAAALCLAGLWVAAMLAGLAGAFLGGPLSDDFLHRSGLPKGREARFWFDYWAHLAAYGGGVLAASGLCIGIWRGRRPTARSLTARAE